MSDVLDAVVLFFFGFLGTAVSWIGIMDRYHGIKGWYLGIVD